MAALSLREENEVLREENRQLRERLFPSIEPYRGLRLSRGERCLIEALLAPDRVCSKAYLTDYLAVCRPLRNEPAEDSIPVLISQLRKKLRVLSPPIEINTKHQIGYYMTADNKARLLARKEP